MRKPVLCGLQSDNTQTSKVCFKISSESIAAVVIEPWHEKTCLCNMQTTKAQISLCIRAVSAFVIHCLDSIILLFSVSKISSLYLASVAA